MTQQALSLAQLIDLEWQLLQDETLPLAERHARDRAIGRQMAPVPARREARFLHWLAHVRNLAEPSPGAWIVGLVQRLRFWLAVGGGLVGGSVVRSLLQHEPSQPLDIMAALARLIGVQLLLLALLIKTMTWPQNAAWLPSLHGLLRALVYQWGRLSRVVTARLPSLQPSLDRLQGLNGYFAADSVSGRLSRLAPIYSQVERWQFITLTQWGGLWFNLGALGCLLYYEQFTGLHFGWQSTRWHGDPATVHAVLTWLAWPWSWLGAGPPALADIARSEFSHLAVGDTLPLVPAWSSFLLAAVLVYGLLLRLLTWVIASTLLRRARRAIRLDAARFVQLDERLQAPTVRSLTPCVAITWGQVESPQPVQDVLLQHYNWQVAELLHAGASLADEDACLQRLASYAEGYHPVCLLVPDWEAPTQELWHFVAQVRALVGPLRRLVIALIAGLQPRPQQYVVWQQACAALGDLHLEIATLTPEPVVPVVPPDLPSPPVAVAAPPSASGSGVLLHAAGTQVDPALPILMQARFGWQTLALYEIGHMDVRQDAATLQHLAQATPAPAAVLLLVEPWEVPTADHGALLRQVRASLGTAPTLLVGLRGGQHRASWQAAVADLHESRVHLEMLGEEA